MFAKSKLLYKQLQRKAHECKEWQTRSATFEVKLDGVLDIMDGKDKKIQTLQLEIEVLKKELINSGGTLTDRIRAEVFTDLQNENDCIKKALYKIKEIANRGLKSICYKSNCNRCQCYDGDDSKIAITALINNYFTENGEFLDGNCDFYEALEGLVEKERARCNKAKPLSDKILAIINELKGIL